MLELGFTTDGIKHRLAKGRLHRMAPGIYAVGRPALDRWGKMMAAVLVCGDGAALSHDSAAAALGIRAWRTDDIHVSVHRPRQPRNPGITVHRRTALSAADITSVRGIPVTTVICTLIDLALRVESDELEAAVNEADKLDLADPEALRAALDSIGRRPGVAALRRLLDRRTFRLTDSRLERRLLPITARAQLPPPQTQVWLNGHRVDFYWPDLGLIVETDGLRYHRTPAQQARDRIREQVHAAAGFTTLRFTYAQVAFEPSHVERTLRAVASRLRG